MQKYHQHFSEIDNIYWTNYFLNEFIPKYKFDEKISGTIYIEYHKKDFNDEPGILELSNLLSSKLGFPPIEYFLIFKHIRADQLIHVDGIEIPRNASFNLPLIGYEGTTMCFYEENILHTPSVSNARYYPKENLTLVETFAGGNEWVLVDTSVPHNIINVDPGQPRLTLCVRFHSNPTFNNLMKNAKS